MAFRVEIEPQAFEDLDAIVEHIKAHSSFKTAERWFRSMMRSIRSLEEMPGRCPIAEESEELGQEVQRRRLGIANFADKKELADRLDAFVQQWNRRAHGFRWSRKSFDKVLAECEKNMAAAA